MPASGAAPATQHSGLSTQHSSRRSGPNTPQGRAAVSLNALSHGLRSERPVLPGESQEEWDAFLAATLDSLAPQGPHQVALARRAALSLWRLQRVTQYETAQTLAAWQRAPEDAAAALGLPAAGHASRDALAAAAERSHALAATLSHFATLQDQARLPREDALAVLCAAAEQCRSLASRLPSILDVPLRTIFSRFARDAGYSLGPDPDLPCALVDRWTAADVRALLAAFAVHQEFTSSPAERPLPPRDPARPGRDRGAAEGLLRRATTAATEEAAAHEALLARLDSQTQRLREERALFPPEDVLARVQRYESHLNRQYQAAVRELRALQSLPARSHPKSAEQLTAAGEAQTAERAPSPPNSETPPEPPELPEAPKPAEQSQPPKTPGRARNEAHYRLIKHWVDEESRGRRVAIMNAQFHHADHHRDYFAALDDPDSLIVLDGKEISRARTTH